MQTTINQHPFTFEPDDDETAIEVIRERAGLTGAKLVCGSGVCGACTILLDGTPVASCLLSAHALEGRTVQTIEGVGQIKNLPHTLHPIQRAFMACDALQCGFCTPGFILSSIAFYEQWRKAHGTQEPSREQIAEALSGHLCRCGAYVGIYEAVRGACSGKFDEGIVTAPRVDAIEKVTGRARYTVDVRYDGMLEGKILRSPHAHAKVIRLDTTTAQSLHGVKAIVELLPKDRIVRYIGQEILAVAATDWRTAERALELVTVQYEVRPHVIGMNAARKHDALPVYPELYKNAPSAAEGPIAPGRWRGNVRAPFISLLSDRSRRARALLHAAHHANTTHLVEGTWHTAAQMHTALEPHACVARWTKDGQLIVHLSTQGAVKAAHDIAAHFQLKHKQVRVLCEHVGGGFGAKLAITAEAVAAIELSRKAHAPVRVVCDRLVEMMMGGYRPATEINLAMLADAKGNLAALSARAFSDSGVAIGSLVTGIYRFIYPNAPKELLDFDVVNHLPPGKPFRAPGGPPAYWALEQAVDQIAHQLEEDPLALRKRWDPDPLRQKLYAWAAQLPAWRARRPVAADRGRFRRGIGVAAGQWLYLLHPTTQVSVTLSAEGVTASCATQDIGTGTRSVIAHAVASVLELDPTAVDVQVGDSQFVRGPLSGGSRVTTSVYPAARAAAAQAKQKLLKAAQAQFKVNGATLHRDGIYHTNGHIPWVDIWRTVPPITAIAGRGHDTGGEALPLSLGADGVYAGRGFTGAVHVSEVEVDTRFGRITVLRVWGGIAAGKIVVPALARSQCYGGIMQGIGFALYEERQLDPQTGLIVSVNLEDYHLPGLGDTPNIELHFLEEGFGHVPGSAVGLAELSTLAVAASIGNAVFHATGWRPYELPIRVDRLLKEFS
jgi:xanthine dehydrogenase YagR molybdenum-binding subunit